MRKLVLLSLNLFFISPVISQIFTESQKIITSDRNADDRMGWSVDMDGNFAVVGAYGDDFGDTDPNMGSAYVYEKIEGNWTQVQKLIASDQDDYDRFGWSVAIDGDVIVIGAYAEDHDATDDNPLSKAGSAYIFERTGSGDFVEVQKIVAADRAAGDEFGFDVAVHGGTIVVGAHADDKDEFGEGYYYHAGSAYIFDRSDDGVWSQTQKIVASDQSAGTEYPPGHEDWNDRYGEGVAIWNDYVAVAAPFGAKSYMYERSGGVWTEVATLSYVGLSGFDRCIDVAIDSTTCIVGTETEDDGPDGEPSLMNSGGAAIFKRIDGTWEFTQRVIASDRSAGDHFGVSVSIDGDYFVVGANQEDEDEDGENELTNAGSLYVFKLNDDGLYEEEIKLDASDRKAADELGHSCAISGNTLITGAWHQGYNAIGIDLVEESGAAYFYTTNPDDIDDCENVFVTQNPSICPGESFEVGANVYDTAGTYTDVLTKVDGCDSIVTTVLTLIGPEIDTEVELSGVTLTSQATGSFTYQWVLCPSFTTIDGATEQSYEATVNGLYAVIISNGSCTDTSSCYTINSVGLEKNQFELDLNIHPNPSSAFFTITSENNLTGKIYVLNTIGAIVYEDKIEGYTQNIDLSNASSGSYIIKITTDRGTAIKQINIIR